MLLLSQKERQEILDRAVNEKLRHAYDEAGALELNLESDMVKDVRTLLTGSHPLVAVKNINLKHLANAGRQVNNSMRVNFVALAELVRKSS